MRNRSKVNYHRTLDKINKLCYHLKDLKLIVNGNYHNICMTQKKERKKFFSFFLF